MTIVKKIIVSLASLSGTLSILLTLFSLALSYIDYAASLFAFVGIPFALFSLFSGQGGTWIKIFAVIFVITFCTYSYRSMSEQDGQSNLHHQEAVGEQVIN